MELVAEYVSPGHPDRICDNIVNRCVKLAISKVHTRSLVGLECAVHTNKVFLDGRIAAGYTANYKGYTEVLDWELDNIVKKTYEEIGYNKKYFPDSADLEIIKNVCIEHLSDEEDAIRPYSDDQNIVCGFAINEPNTNFMPIEHYLAYYIGHSLWEWYKKENIEFLGPDFKLMVHIFEENQKFRWERLTLSWEHDKKSHYKKIYPIVKEKINEILKMYVSKMKINNERYVDLSIINDKNFLLNGAGDFIQGGPDGDNGLSGKKLVIDYYGPRVPIGGGAIFGKDPYKVDVCGAYKAREFAIRLLKENNCKKVYTKLAWSPGDQIPNLIDAYESDNFGTNRKIDKKYFPAEDTFSIENINKDLNLRDKISNKLVDSALMNIKLLD